MNGVNKMGMKIGEFLDRTGKHLSEKCWSKFGKDISKLKCTPEDWEDKIEQMENTVRGYK